MKVSLVGAGPGGIGLLTLKGIDALQAADVVLYDRFVGEDILAAIPENVEKIDVGKSAGNHPMPQNEINELLRKKARQGKNVVRLKGGDPLVFARGGEELEFLAEAGIPFEIVPGVTATTAAAAYAGIPLTHRDCASSFHIITAHAKNSEKPNIDFDALVKLNGTLVFLMGVAAIGDICEGCVSAGMVGDMPAAIVENAAANSQRKFLGTVAALPQIARENFVKSPSVIIIGKVCGFSERYDWFGRKPLRYRRVIVARVKAEASKLSDILKELGCDVVEMPCLRIVALTGSGCMLEKKLENITDYSWLVFTSVVGVNIFFDYLFENEIDIRKLRGIKIACVGIETEKEVNRRGIRADYVPAEYNSLSLSRGLANIVNKGEKLLIVRAKDGHTDLTRILADAKIAFDDVYVYEKIKDAQRPCGITDESGFDFVAFTCSSAVKVFAEYMAKADFSKIKAVCIGERTAAAAKEYGMEVYVSKEATITSMVEKIKGLIYVNKQTG